MKYNESFVGIIKKNSNNKTYDRSSILIRIKEDSYVTIYNIDEFKSLSAKLKLYKIIKSKKYKQLKDQYNNLVIMSKSSDGHEFYVDKQTLKPHVSGKELKQLIKHQREVDESYKAKFYE